MVKNNLSPISPSPGLSIPRSVSSSSTPASQISTPAGHSAAAALTPGRAPRTDNTMMRFAPHSRSVWMAATQVPPVAMTGSRMTARSEGPEPPAVRWFGRLL